MARLPMIVFFALAVPFTLTLSGCGATRNAQTPAGEADLAVDALPSRAADPQVRPRVYTSLGPLGADRVRIFPLDPAGTRVMLQLVGREGIAEGAWCEMRVRNLAAVVPAYVGSWRHRREYDHSGIPLEAKEYSRWRDTLGNYVLELLIDGRLIDRYSFEIRDDVAQPLRVEEASIPVSQMPQPSVLRQHDLEPTPADASDYIHRRRP